MKRILIALLIVGGGWLIATRNAPVGTPAPSTTLSSAPAGASESNAETVLARAFENQQSNLQIRAQGVVRKLLSDDRQGSRHQRFLLELGSGQTLLIAHNIDLAPRIESLREGDTVAFFGEYEWNDKGGVIHWTHRDPQGRHPDGWLEHNGRRYQ
ncbi:MAG TPA: DUF3465 domain-containing protein [Povalibacter sp.]|uniref:DUF3465 domain-containing protein n=1 Tax=Povalibacter sp. TaxID=1962978 RepID=UPI002B741F02|nr:DUF3465 domain-containing protein [Povalibacter sp.]HMN45594.1 DUF3465 domain-containing protein [Povalibacter sp.]